ncbi:MAG: hypothetical protein JWR38_2367 [Mucilaginibacter sp.]|nr:hypothetical protein [Mucilaginibacter sp.]
MKSHFKYLPLLVISGQILICQVSAQTNNVSKLKKAAWLIGTWKHQSPKGSSTETWHKLNDSTYIAKSYVLRGTDTVSTESVRLEQRDGNLYYIPTVKNQNEGKPVSFKLTTSSAGQLVFENATHDFPQKITYTPIKQDSLLAEISGSYKGKQRAIQFPMKKEK